MPDTPPRMAQPRIASGMLIRNRQGQVLLVKPTYKDGWEIPGGYVEPDESPAQGCVREVNEELSLAVPCGALLVVDWAPVPGEGDKILFIFDGGVLPDGLEPKPDGVEISEARFWEPAQFELITPPSLCRRLHVAVTASGRGLPAYAECGLAMQG